MSIVITRANEIIAPTNVRLVRGGRGNYVEIANDQLDRSLIELQPGQEYRLTTYWSERVFYDWYRTRIGHFKLYFQRKTVTYADYKIGFWYIAPADLKSVHS